MEKLGMEDHDFISNPLIDEQLAIVTCPAFNKAKDRAMNDFYEWKNCDECELSVKIVPALRESIVNGKCPKV